MNMNMLQQPATKTKIPLFLFFLLTFCFLDNRMVQAIYLEGDLYSYARYPPWNGCPNSSFSFDFKTSQVHDAILWYSDDNGGSDFFYVALKEGSVRFVVNVVSSKDFVIEKIIGRNLNDGRWHSVQYQRQDDISHFTVDGVKTSARFDDDDLDYGSGSHGYVYVGGLPRECSSNLFAYSLPSACLDGRLRGSVRNVVYGNCTCHATRVTMVDGMSVGDLRPENCDSWNACAAGCVCLNDESGDHRCDCSRPSCSPRGQGSVEWGRGRKRRIREVFGERRRRRRMVAAGEGMDDSAAAWEGSGYKIRSDSIA